jgi:hypothetical protein
MLPAVTNISLVPLISKGRTTLGTTLDAAFPVCYWSLFHRLCWDLDVLLDINFLIARCLSPIQFNVDNFSILLDIDDPQ